MSKTPKEYFSEMPAAFLKENAGNLNATYLFDLSGDEGGTWFVQIRNGELVVGEGAKENPDVVMRANAKDYVDIAEGRSNPMLAMATGKFKIQGNIGLAMKLEKMFKR